MRLNYPESLAAASGRLTPAWLLTAPSFGCVMFADALDWAAAEASRRLREAHPTECRVLVPHTAESYLVGGQMVTELGACGPIRVHRGGQPAYRVDGKPATEAEFLAAARRLTGETEKP